MAKPRKGEHSQHELADMFKTSQSQVSQWILAGMPQEFSVASAQWVMKNAKRKKPDTKKVCEKILAVDKGKQLTSKKAHSVEEVQSLESLRDFYLAKLSEETNADFQDSEAIKLWNDLLIKAEKCIREAQAHERKLGLTQGETITKEECERILKGVWFAGNACVRNQIKSMSQTLANKSAKEIYNMLPAALLGGTLMEGMASVTKAESEVQLPEWVVECFQGEGAKYIRKK